MKQFCIVLSFLVIPIIAYSQEFSLRGKVTDRQDYPLEGAHLHIDNKFILTEENGNYQIDLKEGKHRVTVSYIGFKDVDTVISLSEDTVVNFSLEEDQASLSEVLINGTTRRKTSENIEKVDQTYLQDQFSGSLAKSLEKLPGVNSVEIGGGASKPIIRGLGFNRVAVSENGIKQEGQQWGADHGLEIDALSVENIEIVKGVGAIENGSDAIGGVVRIKNDRVPQNGFTGEFVSLAKSVNQSLTASTNLAYKSDKFFYKLKATGSEFGDYNIPTDNIVYLSQNIPIYNERLKNTAGKENDISAQIGYLGDHYKGTLSFSNVYFKSGFFPGAHGIPSTSRVQDDGDRRNIDYPFQRVNHFKAINKNEWFFHDADLEVILGFQNNNRQEWSRFHTHYSGQQAPAVNPDLELQFNLNTLDAQVKFSKDFSEKHKSSLGIQNQIQDNRIAGFNFLLPEYKRNNHALYATHNYEAFEKLQLNLGARLDISQIEIEQFYDEYLYEYLIGRGRNAEEANDYATRSPSINRNFTNFNIMGGVLYQADKNLDFSLNAGTSFRLPTAIELGANGIHHGSFRHERGDPNLAAEKGFVVDGQANFSKNGWKSSLSPYLYYFDNYIFLNPSGQFSILPHAGQIYQFTQSEAFITGIEFDLHKTFAQKLRTQLTLEYLYNRQLTGNSRRNYPLPFTPPVNGFAEVGYKLFETSSLFTDTELFINSAFAMDQNRIAQNEKTTPGYEIFGGGIKSTLKFGNFKANFNLQATNVFNKKYFNHTNFYRALEIPEMGRNIQLMLRIPINK